MCIGCIITFLLGLRWPSLRSLKRHFNSLRHPSKSMARTRQNMCGKNSVERIKCGKSVPSMEQFTATCIWLPSCKFKSNKNSIRCRIKSAIKHDKIKTKTEHNRSLRTATAQGRSIGVWRHGQTAIVQLLQSHIWLRCLLCESTISDCFNANQWTNAFAAFQRKFWLTITHWREYKSIWSHRKALLAFIVFLLMAYGPSRKQSFRCAWIYYKIELIFCLTICVLFAWILHRTFNNLDSYTRLTLVFVLDTFPSFFILSSIAVVISDHIIPFDVQYWYIIDGNWCITDQYRWHRFHFIRSVSHKFTCARNRMNNGHAAQSSGVWLKGGW